MSRGPLSIPTREIHYRDYPIVTVKSGRLAPSHAPVLRFGPHTVIVEQPAAMLIDTHTHLDDPRYETDRETVMARARDAGVDTFVTIGCDLSTSRSAVALADR